MTGPARTGRDAVMARLRVLEGEARARVAEFDQVRKVRALTGLERADRAVSKATADAFALSVDVVEGVPF